MNGVPGEAVPLQASATVARGGCPLCEESGGTPVYSCADFRVIRAAELGFPAFYRLVWNGHVREFSDLPAEQRLRCMEAVALIEQLMREQLAPTKINLASLGNVVPHLHWHLIARFDWDSHFPAPVWAPAQRERDSAREAALAERLPALERALAERLGALASR